MKTLLTVILITVSTTCFASIEKQQLIDKRIVLMHKIDDIDKAIKAIEKDEMTQEDKKKLRYYKEHLEKEHPTPKEKKA